MGPTPATQALSAAIEEVGRLRGAIFSGNRQIRSPSERALIKATAFSWFNAHRAQVATTYSTADIDAGFTQVLELAEHNTTRARIVELLAQLKTQLVALRTQILRGAAPPATTASTTTTPPNFAALIGDPDMHAILSRRWRETEACLGVQAYLASTVMMGALLEAMLLARVNAHESKHGSLAAIYKCGCVPKDKVGNPLKVKEWKLFQFIDIAHEMGWIAKAAKDVGGVLRDFRNYIHPHKELTDKITVDKRESETLWNVFTTLTRQIIESV